MDMPVNAPVDDPNADTEWYAMVSYMDYVLANQLIGMTFSASMGLFPRNHRPLPP